MLAFASSFVLIGLCVNLADLAGQEEIEQALDEDRYDHITSTYFLLAERALLQQEMNASSQVRTSFLRECLFSFLVYGDFIISK